MKLFKFLLVFHFVYFFTQKVYCQIDTLKLSNGNYKIYTGKEIEFKSVNDSIQMIIREYSEYTENERLIGNRIFLSNNGYICNLWTNEGVKVFEQFNSLNNELFYEKSWDENKNLLYHITANKDSKVIIRNFPNSNTISSLIEYFPFVKVGDSLPFLIHPKGKVIALKRPIKDLSSKQKKTITEFYKNGKIKFVKHFFYQPYDLFINKFGGNKSAYNAESPIDLVKEIKIGEWRFYSQDGQLVEKINFDHEYGKWNCLNIKSENLELK